MRILVTNDDGIHSPGLTVGSSQERERRGMSLTTFSNARRSTPLVFARGDRAARALPSGVATSISASAVSRGLSRVRKLSSFLADR